MAKQKTVGTYAQIERISYIHELLADNSYPNCRKIASHFEVKPLTIQRTIDFMRDRGNAPIAYDRSKKGYYYTEQYTPKVLTKLNQKQEDSDEFSELKKAYARLIGEPDSYIENLEKVTDIGLPNQTGLEINLDRKYCGRSYYDYGIWAGLKKFDFASDYSFCLGLYESFKQTTADKTMKLLGLDFIAERSDIDEGYWLYTIFDKSFLESETVLAKAEIRRLIAFMYPNSSTISN